MQLAGKWMVFLPLTVSLLFAAASVALTFSGASNFFALGIIPLLFSLEVPGVALWLAGWIVEGFAQNPDQNDR
jgi:hypothetical protein